MKVGSEEAATTHQYTFSLRAASHKRTVLNVQHEFQPIRCGKTFKLRSVIPTYRSQYALPFQTDADLPFTSLKLMKEEAQHSPYLMVPKPTNRYCQVCKEQFEDYLKHTAHPIHLQKVRDAHDSLDINLIKELLEKSAPKRKADPRSLEVCEDVDKCSDTTSLRGEEELSIDGEFLFGSKKRIVTNEDGEMEAISVSGSTKGFEENGLGSAKKSIQRCSVSKSILV